MVRYLRSKYLYGYGNGVKTEEREGSGRCMRNGGWVG